MRWTAMCDTIRTPLPGYGKLSGQNLEDREMGAH